MYKFLTLVTDMKRARILPGAAGLIALTATMGFAAGQREIEAENFARSRITLVRAATRIAADDALSGNRLDIKSGSTVYLVEIRRGDKFAEVLIDAVTGRILLS